MNPPAIMPKTFGPFEIQELLGRGATATVYKARHRPSGKFAALKVGYNLMDLESGALARFKREFTTIRRLHHPNLVRALAHGEGDGVVFVAMEYIEGQNLEQLIKINGYFSLEEIVPIFLQVADGLCYLHANKILHRDIKPSNILLDYKRQAKLSDFGLLKDMADEHPLTLSRQGMGTIEYGAPEQFEDAKRVDRRCDLYALAATLYTALTGKFPFGNGGRLQVMQRKLLNQFVPLRMLVPRVDAALDRLVNRCLEHKPDQRPTGCDEFIAVLRGCKIGPRPIGAFDFGPPKTKADDGQERRSSPRFAIDLAASFIPFHQTVRGRWEGKILDVSSGGVRLETSQSVEVDSVLQVTLGSRAIPELVLVRWVRASENQTQIVGCAFVRPLPSQELDAIRQAGAL